jgi:aminobenzoyl-glutamate utilization protein B
MAIPPLRRIALPVALLALAGAPPAPAQSGRLDSLKQEAVREVEARAGLVQRIVDQLFSYGELGFQEFETSRYLVDLLRREGFSVDSGVAGIPTAWVARWGRGRPVLALGSDIDAIPQASQVPGVACRLPLVEGAPGHGEGHNSGQAVNIAAALAVKRLMEREKLPGTLLLWPGVAEEQLGGKPHLVRAGVFQSVDAVLFSHVSTELGTSWGQTYGSGLVSVLYSFRGTPAHAGGRPWAGRSALDAVELMDIGWNFRREHLPLRQRSHSVIVDGGDQPNVVPQTASTCTTSGSSITRASRDCGPPPIRWRRAPRS